jgi:hypothetical protein
MNSAWALRDFDERRPATEVAVNVHRVLCSGEAGSSQLGR